MTEDDLLLVGALMLILKPSPDWGGGWVWPVPDWQGKPARISQEFRPGSHAGVDIMYQVAGKWSAPPGAPILAARDGAIWSVAKTPRGWGVVIDHGPPWATFYQHLESVAVAKGDRVTAGQQIGEMGADPTDPQGLRHLHFETWYRGNGKNAVDPAGAMGGWRRVDWS